VRAGAGLRLAALPGEAEPPRRGGNPAWLPNRSCTVTSTSLRRIAASAAEGIWAQRPSRARSAPVPAVNTYQDREPPPHTSDTRTGTREVRL
jgi:hypothetical protein